MQLLRENLRLKEDRQERLREAYMRKMIRQAGRELYQNIAVVCGAWHAPALVGKWSQKEDNELLKGLPRLKVECTWVPWTYARLSYRSGYGAGIHSPGWYHHIWNHPNDDGTRWMSRVAQLFRKNGMDTSVAHVIEAVRLAESLASLRQHSSAGLEELNEATQSVLCNGEDVRLQLLYDELIVGHELGTVPADIPKPPLQADLEKLQKKLRLPPTADFKDYTLDLRKENDLERSVLLHRLRLLGIKWGELSSASGKGTFKEQWRLQWDPALSVDLIEKGAWGNTVEEAANQYVIHQAENSDQLVLVAQLLQQALPAELHTATGLLIRQVNNLSAANGDVIQLMEVVPGLVSVSRYGNVRKTDAGLVFSIVESMITRICISLPYAVSGIDEEAAENLSQLFYRLNNSVNLLQESSLTVQWQAVLNTIAGSTGAAPLIAGYAARLLKDFNLLTGEDLIRLFRYRMSPSNAPDASASWLEGFLKGSGTLLLLDAELWAILNNWVVELNEEVFGQVLPLLRRTFAHFSPAERRKLGEKANGKAGNAHTANNERFDAQRGEKGIPVVLSILGYPTESLPPYEQ